MAFTFTAASDSCYRVSTEDGLDWAPVLALYTTCGGEEIACADYETIYDYGIWTSSYSNSLNFAGSAGETYLMIVEGYEYGSDSGSTTLTVESVDAISPAADIDLGSEMGCPLVTGDTSTFWDVWTPAASFHRARLCGGLNGAGGRLR